MTKKGKIKKIITLVALSTFLSGCGNSNISYPLKDGRVDTITSYEEMQGYFDIGEHIISISIDEDPRSDIMQYEYHPGYKPVGIAVMSYGELMSAFGGCAIIFVNNEEVVANVTGKNSEGEAVFTDFGTPVVVNTQVQENGVFGAYEHIISIPLDYRLDNENIQFESIEGYELVGVGGSAYGTIIGDNGGGCLLFVNSIPVRVEPIIDKNGNIISYANIGAPIVEKNLVPN